MNVYDFDKTIYAGDSSVDFYLYCVWHYPAKVLRHAIPFVGKYLLYKGRKCDKETMKSAFFSFMREFSNPEKLVSDFWSLAIHKIEPWYLQQQQTDDVIISASPEFLVSVAAQKLGISNVLASPVRINDGIYYGKNCHGIEKVERYKRVFGKEEVDAFYSDSYSDFPMSQLAKKSYHVRNGKCSVWERGKGRE